MKLPFAKQAMHYLHNLHAQLSVAKLPTMDHFSLIREFLIVSAAFQTPSSLGCRQTSPPATPLTLLVAARHYGQKILKSRFAFVRTGFFLFALLALPYSPADAKTITVATAANFQQTLKALLVPFTRQTGDTVKIVTGSSGALATQIINGAPFDVFLSADIKRPQQLVEKGFADNSTLTIYAYGRLTLWSLDKTLIVDNDGPATLKAGKFRHIAYANPALAPYGVAAMETLRSLNLFFELSDKTVRGENISQTFTMLATGAAPLGFIARSQLARPPWKSTGSSWPVPANLHQPIKQAAIIVKNSQNKTTARQFMMFITSNPAKKIIRSFGYDTK